MNHNKGVLLVKPCQSGKTFEMLRRIEEKININDNTLHIIFLDNNLLHIDQLQNRIPDHIKYKNISSRTKNKWETSFDDCDCIITLCNSIQISRFDTNMKELGYDKDIYIWIDEADKHYHLLNSWIKTWYSIPFIKSICYITATPKVLLNYMDLKLLDIDSIHSDEYYKVEDCIIKNKYPDLTTDIKKGDVFLFLEYSYKDQQYELKNSLLQYSIIVLTVNSDGIMLFNTDNTVEIIKKNRKKTISDIIGNVYQEYNLFNKKFAIVGCNRLNRGVTINSPKCVITHIVLWNNNCCDDTLYQKVGRICGNIKSYIDKRITVYCRNSTHDLILSSERRSININNNNNQVITIEDYLNN